MRHHAPAQRFSGGRRDQRAARGAVEQQPGRSPSASDGCVSGSPNRTLNSITRGSPCVDHQPTNSTPRWHAVRREPADRRIHDRSTSSRLRRRRSAPARPRCFAVFSPRSASAISLRSCDPRRRGVLASVIISTRPPRRGAAPRHDDHRSAEPALAHRLVERGERLLGRLAHRDALPRREAVRLHDAAVRSLPHVRARGLELFEHRERRGRDPVALHERLRERLASLELRRGRRRPEHRDPGLAQPISDRRPADPRARRREIDALARAGAVIAATSLADAGEALRVLRNRVAARRGEQRGDERTPGDLPRCVLASPEPRAGRARLMPEVPLARETIARRAIGGRDHLVVAHRSTRLHERGRARGAAT